jgi:hypothetical protein
MFPAVAALASALAGCAALGGGVEVARDSWMGAHFDDVVARWGAPARHATLADGRGAYTWESTRPGGYFLPGSVGIYGSSGGGVGVALGLPGTGGGGHQRCERTLIFTGDRVVEQTWLGPSAFCRTFRRE